MRRVLILEGLDPPSRSEVVDFRLQASHFSWRKKSNQKNMSLASAPIHRKRRSAMARCPALRSRSGVCRRAIPGPTSDASASCLARRQTGAGSYRHGLAVLGVANGDPTSKANCYVGSASRVRPLIGQALEAKAKTNIEGVGTAGSDFDSSLLTFPSHRRRRAPQRRSGISRRVCSRRARQDAEASLYRPGMACTKTPLRLRSTGHPLIALLILR